MICLAILACVALTVLSAPTKNLSNRRERVVGGQKAEQESFNYQVSIMRLGEYICGGALITKNIVITAAHCTEDNQPDDFEVRVGSEKRLSGGKTYYVQEVVSHNSFDLSHFQSDVALFKLFEDVQLSKSVGTIELTNEEPAANVNAVVSGWGFTEDGGPMSDDLQFVEVPIIERSYCQSSHYKFSKEMICAGMVDGGVDACKGDSGGPLVANKKLVGIVSWGSGCARRGKPGVYTNVAHFRSWLDQSIEQLMK